MKSIVTVFLVLSIVCSINLTAQSSKMIQCKAIDSTTHIRCNEMTDFPSGLCLVHKDIKIPTNDSKQFENITINRSQGGYIWASTPFISAGYGYPEGFRVEGGFTIYKYFTAGLSVGIADHWSRYPVSPSSAVFARASLPIPKSSLGLYLSTIFSFNPERGSDEYVFINFGLLVPVNEIITLRPEIGYAWTSRFKSWQKNWFFGNTYAETEDKSFTSFNLIFEFDLRLLLRNNKI